MACTLNRHICNFWRIDFLNERLCSCSIYIQPVLVKKEKAFETIIILALAALVFFLIYQKNWLIYLALTILALPIISSKIAIWISNIWFTFSEYFGRVMNMIVMFICFHFFLVPLAFLQKTFGKNQILKKKEGNSYFIKRDHLFTSKDISKPW